LKLPSSHPIFGASSFVKHPFAHKDAEKATINEKGLYDVTIKCTKQSEKKGVEPR
jgi:hypothetical protein